jgi:hypothetical protein
MTDDRRPKTDDRRPMTDDRRPTTDDRRPTTDDRRPITHRQHFQTWISHTPFTHALSCSPVLHGTIGG